MLWSTTNGATYGDDYGLFSLGPTQAGFMRLEPGPNAMRFSDSASPDLTLEWSFYAAYH